MTKVDYEIELAKARKNINYLLTLVYNYERENRELQKQLKDSQQVACVMQEMLHKRDYEPIIADFKNPIRIVR